MALVQFSGLASGIDSKSLIKAILDQQRLSRITPLEDKNTELQESNSALSELKSLLNTFKSKASKFRTLNGGALAKQINSSDESVLTASATNAAQAGNYNLTISQIAKNSTASLASLNQTYTTSSSVINSAIVGTGTASITVGLAGEAETVDVSVDNTTTLEQFVTNYNSQATKSLAAVVNVGNSSSPDYRIMISSHEQGSDKGNVQINIDAAISSAGSGAFDSNTISQANDATFTMDGIAGTITRSNNTISDLISGVSIVLQGTGFTTISVSNDKTKTASALKEFVDAYNEIVNFIEENDLVSIESDVSGNKNVFSPLAKNSIDNAILTGLRQSFSSASLASGDIRILADLGVTTARDGTLEFDADTFDQALDLSATNTEELLANLGEQLAAVDGVIEQFTRFNGLIDVNSNSQASQIKANNDRISLLEQHLTKQEQNLTAKFAKLEALIGKMQSQQASLGSLLTNL